MQEITVQDIHKINKLINAGYKNAADSFSDVVGREVEVKNLEITAYDHFRLMSEKEDSDTVIVTELIGDLIGESYLVLNDTERKVITDYCRQAFGGSADLSEEAVLKEIDNIISAAMITKFSNELKSKVFGDVPQVMSNGDFERHVQDTDDSPLLFSQARLQFLGEESISPKFIWRFDKSFLERSAE